VSAGHALERLQHGDEVRGGFPLRLDTRAVKRLPGRLHCEKHPVIGNNDDASVRRHLRGARLRGASRVASAGSSA
jgi:hypothetical protein